MYSTSHLFFLGDLNFRVSLPEPHPLTQQLKTSTAETLNKESTRKELKEYDQLLRERRKGSAFIGLKDGEFWKFQCSYKYQLGAVDKYRYLMPDYHLHQRSHPFEVPNGHHPGQTEFSTLHILIHPTNRTSRISQIFYTPPSHPIQPQITYVFALPENTFFSLIFY